jgi:excinuclease ABC subunit C
MSFDQFTYSMPYIPGETTEKSLPGGGGIYLLADAEDHLIQLAAAADIRRALRHKLTETAEETATRRANLRQIVRKIHWFPAHSVFELTYFYYRIARELRPDDYLKQVAFGPAWFVHVDVDANIPRFLPGKWLRSPPGIDLGPFATQTDATRFVEILEDAFDLCRYYHILEQVPHGQACAYFEMGKCPAPCDGTISMSTYREMMVTALQFAIGSREPTYLRLEQKMREAAQRQAFERAGLLKQQWERAQRIEHESYRRVAPIEQFDFLIVQRGGGRTCVKPFFVRGGWITPGEPAKLKDVPQVAAAWIARLQNGFPSHTATQQEQSEHIWLVSHFLFKREAPGLFLHKRELTSPEHLAEQIRSRFWRPTIQTSEIEPISDGD